MFIHKKIFTINIFHIKTLPNAKYKLRLTPKNLNLEYHPLTDGVLHNIVSLK